MIRESGREGGEEEEGNWTKTELGGKGGRRLVERVDHQQQQQAVGGGKAHHRQEIFFFPLALRALRKGRGEEDVSSSSERNKK
jgi:hypothetical protein